MRKSDGNMCMSSFFEKISILWMTFCCTLSREKEDQRSLRERVLGFCKEVELPWELKESSTGGQYYYHNSETGQIVVDPPSSARPSKKRSASTAGLKGSSAAAAPKKVRQKMRSVKPQTRKPKPRIYPYPK
eukprot:6469976-Amphidinium_carterae.2